MIVAPSESGLNALTTLPIRKDLLSRSERACQQTRLAAEEQPTRAQECVCRNVTQSARLHDWSHIWHRLFRAIREPNGYGLFSCFESIEHRCATSTEPEG